MIKVLYLIFGDIRHQTDEDLIDIMQNIKKYDTDASFIINHPNSSLPEAKLKHLVQPINQSNHIFGVFIEFIDHYSKNRSDYDFTHVCLFSANQYQIGSFKPLLGINYFQFYNCDNWPHKYNGKDFSNVYQGRPLFQDYGTWDTKGMSEKLSVPYAMASNWEGSYLTREAIELCTDHIACCLELYPADDMISVFPGYMALKTGQPWQFPPFFGTFDPSNRDNNFNHIIRIDQVIEKKKAGYLSIKRVDYKKSCPVKQFIREQK